MSDPTISGTGSEVRLDLHRILADNDLGVSGILQARAGVMADKDLRKEAGEYLAGLPDTIEAAKDDLGALRSKGLVLFLIGDNRGAEHWLSVAGKGRLVRHVLGLAHLAAGRSREAAKVLEGIAEDEPAARPALTDALLRSGDATEAKKVFRRLTKGDRESADGDYLQGYVCELEGEYEEAYAAYRAAIAKDENHGRALFRLAYMLDLDGNEDEAVELYERVRDLKPTYPNALVNLGVLYEDRGEYTKAVEVYQEVINIHPNHPRARRFLFDAKASLNMYYDEDLERTEDRRAQILRIPISDFELSVRSRNCLAKMQIETLGDLIKKTEPELLSYKNFGETSLQEIKDILAQKGLRLGMGREEQTASVQAAARTLLGIEPEKGDAQGKPIEDLELSVRSRNAMAVLGVATLGDLARLSEKDLMEVKNFGQTSMNEVKEKLAEFGLSLAENED